MMELHDEVELCFPQLLNSSCRKPTLHWSEAVLLNILLSLISPITVALNLLVIISVSYFRQLHTPTNILLLSLAASDFLVGLLQMPLEIYKQTTCWLLGDVLCLLHFCLSWHIVCTSVGSIVLISVDRYMAICDPLHYSTRMTLAKVRCCVCLCWLWSALTSILYMKDELTQPGRSKTCSGECRILLSYVVGLFDLILNFLFPVGVIVVLYMRVFVVAVSQARAMRAHITAVKLQLSLTMKTKRSELKASRTLGILVIVYLLCFCPYYLIAFAGNDMISTSSMSFVIYLIYFNSCLNPIIYALFYPWFRRAVKLIVTLKILQPGSCDLNILRLQKG